MDLKEVMVYLGKQRRSKRLTLRTIVARAGFNNESAVRRLEQPEGNPTLRSVLRYAEAIGVTLTVEVEKMKVLTFFNHAGGVSKTSSVRDIGYTLADLGFRVLLIDADPQASLTKWLGFTEGVELEQTIYPAVINDDIGTLPEPHRVGKLDFIPSSLQIADIELQLPTITLGVLRLRDALDRLEGYDFVLIDSPPSVAQLSALTLVASDHLVVPLPTNSKGLEGLETIMRMLQQYRRANPAINIAFFLLTQYDPRTLHDREHLSKMQERLVHIAPVSSPVHNRPGVYKDAQSRQLPIPQFQQGSTADQEIRACTDELLEVLGVSVRA
jgi:chromosome partitioning protein